jgi:beta-glucosidase
VYVSSPTGNLAKPAKELKAFAKTNLLKPGESQSLAFTLRPSDLASFDAAASAWVIEKGAYGIQVGSSSAAVPLKGSTTFAQTKTVSTTNKVLVPTREINTLKK